MDTCGHSWASRGHSRGISCSQCPDLNASASQAHPSCSLQISGRPALQELTSWTASPPGTNPSDGRPSGNEPALQEPVGNTVTASLQAVPLQSPRLWEFWLLLGLPPAAPTSTVLPLPHPHRSSSTAQPPLPLSSLPTNPVHALWPGDYRNGVSCPDIAASGQGVSDWLELTTGSPHLPHDQGIPLLGPHPTEIKTKTCTRRCLAAFFTVAPRSEKSACPQMREWMKSRGMSSRASCSAMERNSWAP